MSSIAYNLHYHTNYLMLYFSEGTYSILQVVIALQRHTGYFLIQIYLPCTLLVVLSWVGFWLNREATSDRVGLGKKSTCTYVNKPEAIYTALISTKLVQYCH